MTALPPRLRAFVARPALAWWLAAFGVVLSIPSMFTGFAADDLLHKALLRGLSPYAPHGKGVLQLFTFFDGDPTRNRQMTAEGLFPWWTGETIRLSFFRPLAAMTHWLDHALWTDAPWLMHVHSAMWFAAAIALATVVYRRLVTEAPVAGLAALMFALHDSHAIPATWIANRNATIALALGLLTLAAHRRRSWMAPILLGLALTAGESALGTVALLVSHALFLEEDLYEKRALRLARYLPVLIAWVAIYKHYGFGTAGSALYIDPGREPLRFLGGAVERFPLLLAGNLVAAPIDGAFFLPRPGQLAIVACAWVLTALVAVWVAPIVRARPTARFFALAMVLSLLPGCATIPSGRLLMFASFAAMGLFAEAIAYGARRPGRAMLWLRVAVAPGLFVVGSFQMPIASVLVHRFARSLPNDAALAEQDLILVTSFDAAGSSYVSLQRELSGGLRPRHTHVMAVGDQDVAVERLDDRTVLVRPRNGFVADSFSRLFRGEPFAVGMRVEWSHATIEVMEINSEGRAAAARFTFREPLEHPRYRWMKFEGRALAAFPLPRVGEKVTIPPGELF